MKLKTPTHCPFLSPGIPERSATTKKNIKKKRKKESGWNGQLKVATQLFLFRRMT